MLTIKRTIILIVCVTIISSPLLLCGDFSYAYDDDGWENVSSESDTVKAVMSIWKAYQFYYNTQPAGLYTNFTYNKLEKYLADCGYTVDDLNQHLRKRYDELNSVWCYKIFADGIKIVNDIWDTMLASSGITPNSNQTVYSGKYFTDADGNKVMCFITYGSAGDYSGNVLNVGGTFTAFGTKYTHYGSEFVNMSSVTYHTTSTQTLTKTVIDSGTGTGSGSYQNFRCIQENYQPVYAYTGYIIGYDCIIYNTGTNKYYLGTFIEYNRLNQDSSINYRAYRIRSLDIISNDGIKGNSSATAHRGDDTNKLDDTKDHIITPPDDLEDPEDEPIIEPVTPTQPPTDPNVPNPTGGNVNPESGDVNWQMPNLNIDWDLGDFTHIFPFSIPYDLIDMFEVLDTDPVTPHVEGEIDFGTFQYDLDIELDYFDEFMEYVRAFELFGWVVGLIIATRGIFKIY